MLVSPTLTCTLPTITPDTCPSLGVYDRQIFTILYGASHTQEIWPLFPLLALVDITAAFPGL